MCFSLGLHIGTQTADLGIAIGYSPLAKWSPSLMAVSRSCWNRHAMEMGLLLGFESVAV